MSKKIVIGIDCGLKGGITILGASRNPIVYDMPVIKEKKGKKTKNIYNIGRIVEIFKTYMHREVACGIELQGGRPGEGSVSSRTIGEGFGILKGAAHALFSEVVIIPPKKWKSKYPNLITQDILDLREEQKEIRAESKELLLKEKDIKERNKKLKDETQKKKNKKIIRDLHKQQKDNKKRIETLNRKVKSISKNNAREMAMLLCPKIKDLFVRKKDDGRAESFLIARYLKGLK